MAKNNEVIKRNFLDIWLNNTFHYLYQWGLCAFTFFAVFFAYKNILGSEKIFVCKYFFCCIDIFACKKFIGCKIFFVCKKVFDYKQKNRL